MYNTVAFIPARGGSKSIPLKNIKEIGGKPLIWWTIKAAIDCDFIEKVFVSTDSEIIKNCVEEFGFSKVEVIERSSETSTDTASSESVLLEFCQKTDFDKVFFIQATSPLLATGDLKRAWEKFHSSGVDSMLSVVRKKQFIWHDDGTANYDPINRPRRQDWDGYLVENGAFYLSSKTNILSSKCRISGKMGFYEMDENSIFEIDEPSDWIILENLLLNKQ
jgi:CMP-N-acetylneuraminic acid synthetase